MIGRPATFLMVVFLASTLALPHASAGADDMTTIYVQESEVPIVIDGNITRTEWGKTQETKYTIFRPQPGIKQEGFFRVQLGKDDLFVAGELITDITPERGDGFYLGFKPILGDVSS